MISIRDGIDQTLSRKECDGGGHVESCWHNLEDFLAEVSELLMQVADGEQGGKVLAKSKFGNKEHVCSQTG